MKTILPSNINPIKICDSNSQETNKKQKVLQQWEETLNFVNETSANPQNNYSAKNSHANKVKNFVHNNAETLSKEAIDNLNSKVATKKAQIHLSLSNSHIDWYNSRLQNITIDSKVASGSLITNDSDVLVSKNKSKAITKLSETMSRLLPVENAKLLYSSDGKLKLYIRNYVSHESLDKKKLLSKIRSLCSEFNIKIDAVMINGINMTLSL
ncbi:hypothetical protein [Zooshikella sp. RANM57]|uniref:hypothetical protein n=1 Tax=Zooshikella sp. RANM57 TaxID=3425863 RepID=UPI003D6FD3E3